MLQRILAGNYVYSFLFEIFLCQFKEITAEGRYVHSARNVLSSVKGQMKHFCASEIGSPGPHQTNVFFSIPNTARKNHLAGFELGRFRYPPF